MAAFVHVLAAIGAEWRGQLAARMVTSLPADQQVQCLFMMHALALLLL